MTGQTVLNYSISGLDATRTLIYPRNEISSTRFSVSALDDPPTGPLVFSHLILKTFFTLYASENISRDLMEKVEEKVGWDEWQPSYIVFLFLEACQLMTSLKTSRITLSPSSEFHSQPSVRRQLRQIQIHGRSKEKKIGKCSALKAASIILPPLKTSLMLTQAASTLDHVLIIFVNNLDAKCEALLHY